MLPELKLAYVFLFTFNTNFTIFVTETSHGNDDNSNIHPQIDTTSSTDAEDSVDDVRFGKFLFVPRQTVLINQPLKYRLLLYWFTSQTLILVVQSVVVFVFSMHQLRGQDGAGRSLPAMPATGEM